MVADPNAYNLTASATPFTMFVVLLREASINVTSTAEERFR